MTFVCVICRITGPRADGRPVDDTRYPSWRCADSEACAARYLASPYNPRHAANLAGDDD